MRIPTKFILLIFLLIEIYSLRPQKKAEGEFTPMGFGHSGFVSGAVHVHSRHSDGTGNLEEIGAAAAEAGLHFVVVTDLDTSAARAEEGTHSGVDTFVEMEATTPAGHAVLYYSHTVAREWKDERVRDLAWRHYQGKETVPDLFLSVSHPSHPKNPWTNLDKFPDGIEVVSFDAQWQRQLDQSFLGFALTAALNPFNNYLAALRFAQVNRKDLTVWDAMNAVSPGKFGILGVDARANLKFGERSGLAWPSYRKSFVLGHNVLFYDPPLAPTFEGRRKQLYHALKDGRSAIVYPFIHPFSGNQWELGCGNQVYTVGDKPNFEPGCEFRIELPAGLRFPAIVRLYRQGELFKEWKDPKGPILQRIEGPGAYRVEVWVYAHSLFYMLLRDEIPYVLYNPIYVK